MALREDFRGDWAELINGRRLRAGSSAGECGKASSDSWACEPASSEIKLSKQKFAEPAGKLIKPYKSSTLEPAGLFGPRRLVKRKRARLAA